MTSRRLAPVAGLAGLMVLGASAVLAQPAAFYQGYLTAFLYWAGLPLGVMTFALIHPLVGGSWGAAIRAPATAMLRAVPMTAMLFVPLAFGLPALYAWASPTADHARGYLVPMAFLLRAALYFVVWIGLSLPLARWTSSGSASAGSASKPIRTLCAAGLCLQLLLGSLAAVDWAMSLEPGYYSTGFALIVLAGQAVFGLAFCIAAAYGLGRAHLLPEPALTKSLPLTYRDLGSLLAAATLLWAYVQFAQLIVNWSGDTSREATWYLKRSLGRWPVVAVLLVALHFAVPFFSLLFRSVKDSPRRLAGVAVLLMIMHAADVHWLVMPSLGVSARGVWPELTLWIGMGLLITATFAWALPALPKRGLAQ